MVTTINNCTVLRSYSFVNPAVNIFLLSYASHLVDCQGLEESPWRHGIVLDLMVSVVLRGLSW